MVQVQKTAVFSLLCALPQVIDAAKSNPKNDNLAYKQLAGQNGTVTSEESFTSTVPISPSVPVTSPSSQTETQVSTGETLTTPISLTTLSSSSIQTSIFTSGEPQSIPSNSVSTASTQESVSGTSQNSVSTTLSGVSSESSKSLETTNIESTDSSETTQMSETGSAKTTSTGTEKTTKTTNEKTTTVQFASAAVAKTSVAGMLNDVANITMESSDNSTASAAWTFISPNTQQRVNLTSLGGNVSWTGFGPWVYIWSTNGTNVTAINMSDPSTLPSNGTWVIATPHSNSTIESVPNGTIWTGSCGSSSGCKWNTSKVGTKAWNTTWWVNSSTTNEYYWWNWFLWSISQQSNSESSTTEIFQGGERESNEDNVAGSHVQGSGLFGLGGHGVWNSSSWASGGNWGNVSVILNQTTTCRNGTLPGPNGTVISCPWVHTSVEETSTVETTPAQTNTLETNVTTLPWFLNGTLLSELNETLFVRDLEYVDASNSLKIPTWTAVVGLLVSCLI
ncbi:hypothetical protein TBLA_0B01180 [Henningerozyma blattae CBS 6284]|uniref:Flo11 domain-containing protein n=1 Tax=Henningerozyma blattae (strain ATCC 34711 / CBS 6284 / DSM 70876 / NBRC 10599 / NRRL Y-10934 / UCD 77-7) TaxID=1071380 RepID=I2GXV9_HENB6|nr:hypothetical protein TBLA_0B01180 [Tetrapisispora blattae CBS 6284]CCH58961.1 hypothetical protein TBLA_0B01180 [Tetrapisispora blattae CBS 6284]